MSQSELKRLALLMAVNCVRNTVIEDYHSEGKLSDAEMMVFNQEVANKIFTFLTYVVDKPADDRRAFLNLMGMMYPSNWDKPKLDSGFVEAVKQFKQLGNPLEQVLSDTSSQNVPAPRKSAPRRKKN